MIRVILLFFVSMAMLLYGCKDRLVWHIKLVHSEDDALSLVHVFKLDRTEKIIFDWKVFSHICYAGESVNSQIQAIIPEDFRHNQVIIENEQGEMRLYSELVFHNDEVKSIPEDNCMHDSFQYLGFDDRTNPILQRIYYLSDILVSPDDDKIRFIYLFTPTEKQKMQGYTNLVLTSNWLKIR